MYVQWVLVIFRKCPAVHDAEDMSARETFLINDISICNNNNVIYRTNEYLTNFFSMQLGAYTE